MKIYLRKIKFFLIFLLILSVIISCSKNSDLTQESNKEINSLEEKNENIDQSNQNILENSNENIDQKTTELIDNEIFDEVEDIEIGDII